MSHGGHRAVTRVLSGFAGARRSGAQGKGVAGRIRPHWIRPATPSWFPWCAGRGFPRRAPARSRTRRRHKGENKTTVPVGAWARPGRERIWARPWARAADRGGGGPPRARGQVRRITPPSPRCRPGPSPRVGGTRSAGPRRSGRGSCGSRSSRPGWSRPWCPRTGSSRRSRPA